MLGLVRGRIAIKLTLTLVGFVALTMLLVGLALNRSLESFAGESPEARLRMVARGPLETLVVYTPPGEAFFCVEPVSHITEAFNLVSVGHQDTGMLTLASGESARAVMSLTPEAA